ncbi:MAG: alpha/beta hydrolase [Nitriliruptorales bacterium]|nr:alpha/beta hydrolase [Nitriliruptorales bacterium]
MVQQLPIVYVRGFAGTTAGIDAAVENPFYGFNDGSTHVRVGGSGDPLFYQFESPLLRLMIDHDYQLIVKGDQKAWLLGQQDGEVDPATIWIHRFYDVSASTFGEKPQAFTPEKAAENLLDLIELLQRKTRAPRVHLVAHSMGGLICRSLIQKIIPERQKTTRKNATDYVERFFTYATPHGGIEFDVGFGVLERLRDTFGIGGGEIFGPRRMYEYLTPGKAGSPPPKWRPQDVPDEVFPKHRIFSLIGTNPADYGVARGLSSKAVGAKSDGLVQIENAYIPGAKFAYVHRSHSGRYGIVNSEEGYQNLRRFLFGGLEVQAEIVRLQLPHSDDPGVVWQAETELAVRGLPILMHQQVAAHHCPINVELPAGTADNPVPLITTFLLADPHSRPDEGDPARYTLHLRVLSLREQRRGIFDFDNHLEQTADFDDVLIVDVGTADGRLAAWARWNSQLPMPLRDYRPSGKPLEDEDQAAGIWITHVPLPESARAFLGQNAAVRLTVFDRDQAGLAGLRSAGATAPHSPTRPISAARPQPTGNLLTRTIRRVFGRR